MSIIKEYYSLLLYYNKKLEHYTVGIWFIISIHVLYENTKKFLSYNFQQKKF